MLTDTEILHYHPIAERRLLRDIVHHERFTEYFESFLSHYRLLHKTHCDGLYDGVGHLLSELTRRGYRLGIVTGKSRRAWEMTALHAQLDSFDVVITDDDVTHPKPHADGLHAALRAMSLEPSQTFYIGDSLYDCQRPRRQNPVWRSSVVQIETRITGLPGGGRRAGRRRLLFQTQGRSRHNSGSERS